MIELIVSWVAGIVFATLFATFLELLLPSSSMQTFVRVIMGLLIMLAILNPVMGFLERPTNSFEVAALAPRVPPAELVKEEAISVARSRERLIRDVYRRDLAKQMQSLVLGIEGVARASIQVECSDSPDSLMKIKLITVAVQPGTGRNQVRKVIIGDNPQANVLQPEVANKIQQRLAELYQLQPSQIIVKAMQS